MVVLPSRIRSANSCLGRNLAQILRIVRDITDLVQRYPLERTSTVGQITLERGR